MNVSAWWGGSKDKKVYGIRVGETNRDRYFDLSWVNVHVEMDGVVHCFKLSSGFWDDCPEFRDLRGKPIIEQWLQKYRTIDWPKGQPPKMKLIQLQLSVNKFKLIP